VKGFSKRKLAQPTDYHPRSYQAALPGANKPLVARTFVTRVEASLSGFFDQPFNSPPKYPAGGIASGRLIPT